MPASPAGIAYNDLTGIENYAHPGGFVDVDSSLVDDPRVKAVAAAGADVAVYVNFMEAPDTYGSPDRDLLYGGHPIRTDWQWSPRRSNYSGTTMTDVRQGSAWWAHALGWFGPFLDRHPHVTLAFLDVQGERLWTSVWSSMSAAERTAWSSGMAWSLPQLHAIAAAREVKLMVNGTWALGNRNAEGACVEGHSIAENASGTWTTYLGSGRWAANDHLVITHSAAETAAWAKVPNVRWVAYDQSGYARVGPVWGAFVPPDGEPVPAPPPTLQKPVPPAFSAAPLPDGTVLVVVEPLPDSVGVVGYQVYGTGQDDPGKNHKVIPAGSTILSGLAPDVPITLRMSAENAAGYGDWAPVAGLVVRPHVEAPPPPPPDLDPCRDVRATLAQTVSELTAEREKSGELSTQLDASIAQVLGLVARAESAEAAARTATTERDQARAALAEATADLEAIEGDLRKIKGSAGSPAGNAADRLRGAKGRAMKAIERIKD